VKGSIRKLKTYFPLSAKDTLISIIIILIASGVCALLRPISDSDFHVPLIFVLAVFIISRGTEGYFYGIVASLVGVVAVNFVFTYPYFAFNFTLAGYPLTFLTMLATSIMTCAMTTQIKQQERFRIESEKEKMRANLLRAISHDLRTPLTSIVGSTTAILENSDTLPQEKQRELLIEVREDAQWLIRMVENLLSITRIGDKAAEIRKEPEAVEEIIGEAIGKFKKQFPNMPVSVVIPDELLLVPMDAMLIEQVIINILYNSAVHGEHCTAIRLSVTNDGNDALFSICDNGIGFPANTIPHIFDGYFSQVEEKRAADNRRNMGIGLSVCMSIVKAHGGRMIAENAPEGGAVIRFSLPLKEE
jgi:two-component system sensor histidine kinase KdpD